MIININKSKNKKEHTYKVCSGDSVSGLGSGLISVPLPVPESSIFLSSLSWTNLLSTVSPIAAITVLLSGAGTFIRDSNVPVDASFAITSKEINK